MRSSILLGFSMAAALSTSMMGCDEVAKAVDANNNQPGEADGRAVELASMPQHVASMAADASEIWIVAANGEIAKRPRSATAAAPVKVASFARAGVPDDGRAVLDADFLYVLDSASVSRIPRAGGPAEKLTEAAPSGLAVTADAVYVASTDEKRIVKIDKKTKTVSDLASGFGLVVDIVADGNRLVVADRTAETITSVSLENGTKTDLAKNQSRPYALGLGPDHVYWGNGSLSDANKAVEDRIYRIKKDGSGAPEVVVAKVVESVGQLAADGQYLYLGRHCGGVDRVAVTGGEPVKFLNAAVQDIQVSDQGLLVVEDNGCRYDEAAKSAPNRLLFVGK